MEMTSRPAVSCRASQLSRTRPLSATVSSTAATALANSRSAAAARLLPLRHAARHAGGAGLAAVGGRRLPAGAGAMAGSAAARRRALAGRAGPGAFWRRWPCPRPSPHCRAGSSPRAGPASRSGPPWAKRCAPRCSPSLPCRTPPATARSPPFSCAPPPACSPCPAPPCFSPAGSCKKRRLCVARGAVAVCYTNTQTENLRPM